MDNCRDIKSFQVTTEEELVVNEKIEKDCAAVYGISVEELRKRVFSYSWLIATLKKKEDLIEKYERDIHNLQQGDYEEATNEAFDLGFSVALHDNYGHTWDGARKVLEEIKERYKKERTDE